MGLKLGPWQQTESSERAKHSILSTDSRLRPCIEITRLVGDPCATAQVLRDRPSEDPLCLGVVVAQK